MASTPRIGLITRIEQFSSAHRLHNPSLTDDENRAIYGKCNNPNGHGHNYTVEVTVKGPIDSVTGMIMNISDLKVILQAVIGELDHRHLDMDVDYFKAVPSSAENIAVYIWDELVRRSDDLSKLLYEVRLHETDKNKAIYRGE